MIETITLTQKQFDDLPEYSCSIPTGTTIGKQWKKNIYAFTNFSDKVKRQKWFLCEYIKDDDPKMVGILYKQIVAVVRLKQLKQK